ncbi:MAG: NAD(P)-dependent oxidoreductase [Gloeobacteraceae cyanobacterium ES-bin-144]|nr:NAD(P)-dependent oxidoreductase [Verrucomicrobiales bacterium]
MSCDSIGKVAVLGLGIVGSRACLRLAEAGLRVSCWNRTPKGFDGETQTPEQAVDGASIISIYLKDAPAVREVVTRIAPCLLPNQIVLNHSTVDLETTKWLDEICGSRGCRFLDAPFTGSKVAAETGQLIYYIGGEESLADELESYLSITSRKCLHCGAVGAATVIKLATNLISACTLQAMAESLAITIGHGVSGECLVAAVAENASSSGLMKMKFPMMLSQDFETHFSLSNMGKDSRYMLALAASAGVETPAIAAVSQRMADLCALGLGDHDFSVLAKPYLEPK